MTGAFESYYVVIFTSIRSKSQEGYDEMDKLTFELVEQQPGYLGAESFFNEKGKHVTIVSFQTAEDIRNWKANPVHREAQDKGKHIWYDYYNVKVCRVEREYEFKRK